MQTYDLCLSVIYPKIQILKHRKHKMISNHIQAGVQRYDFDSYKWEPLAENTEDWTQQNHPEWLELTSDQDYHGDDFVGGINILLIFFYVMLGGLGICVVVYAIIKCCHENNDTSQSQSRNHSILPRGSSRIPVRRECQHRSCIINRNDGCLFETNSSRHRDNIANQFTTIVPANNDWNLETHHLDIPITYANSTSNSRASSMHNLDHNSTNQISSSNNDSDMPPSYEEALACIFVAATSGGGEGGDSGGGGGDSGGGGGDSGGGGGDSGGGGGDSGGGGGDSGGGGGDSGGGGGDSGGGGGGDD